MIRPEELRIGNWLYWNKKTPRRVTPSTFGLSDYELETQYSPIPLSPEILEKAGFVLNDDCRYCIEPNKTLEIRLHKVDFSWELCGAFGESIVPDSDWFKYLHQLQNIYHALTNQELIINL